MVAGGSGTQGVRRRVARGESGKQAGSHEGSAFLFLDLGFSIYPMGITLAPPREMYFIFKNVNLSLPSVAHPVQL